VLTLLAVGLRALKIIFAPKLLVKRILLVASLQIFVVIFTKLYSILHFVYYELGNCSTLASNDNHQHPTYLPVFFFVLGSRQHALRHKMKKAPTYNDWAHLARELDVVVGNEAWKADKQSPFFDYKLIEQKTNLFAELMESNDAEGLMWHLRKGLLRVCPCLHFLFVGFSNNKQTTC